MFAAWALKNWRPLAVLILLAALLALAAFGFWRGLVEIGRLQTEAASAARLERDTHWRAEIAKANAAVANARADQAVASARAESAARDVEDQVQARLKQLGEANAALPGGDHCGLSRDRVRLLNER